METTIEELDKCECVSSVIKIAPVFGIDNEKMGALGILIRNNDGVYVCICSVYSKIKNYGHNWHFSMTVILRQQ